MNFKGILLAGAFLIGGLSAHAQSGSRAQKGVVPVFQDEGRDPIYFNMACSSHTWTVVSASDTIRRSILMQLSLDSRATVCLSSITAASHTCTDTTTGVELSSSTPSLTDFTSAAWRCRSREGGNITGRVRGYIARDRADFPAIGW